MGQKLYERGGDINGTCLQGYVDARGRDLLRILGEPEFLGDDKVPYQWVLRGPYGVVTLYLYKVDAATVNSMIRGDLSCVRVGWHIGARGLEAAELFRAGLLEGIARGVSIVEPWAGETGDVAMLEGRDV